MAIGGDVLWRLGYAAHALTGASASALIAIAVLMAACSTAYSPPVRAGHGGGPRRSFESVMVDLSDTEVVVPGVMLRVPLTERLAAEGGGDVSIDNWFMGHAAMRWTTPVGPDGPGQLGAADIEIGAGLGEGGKVFSADEDPDALVKGVFAGAGFGTHGDLFGGYVRTRVQYSGSDETPNTRWLSLLFGVQWGSESFRFRAAAGVAEYRNSVDRESGPLIEVGFEIGGESR